MPTPKQGQAAQNVVPGIADPGSLGVPEDEQLGQGEQLTITGSADQIAKLTGRPEVKQVEAQQAPQAAPEQPEVATPTEQAATGESFRQGFVDAPQDSPLPQAQSGGVQQGQLDKVAVALAAEAAGGPLAGAAAIQTLQGLEDAQPVGGPLGIATNAALGAIEQESIRQDEQQQAQEQAQQQADDLEEDNQGSVDAAISATDQSFKQQQDNLQELQAARDTLGKAARGELTLDSPARRVFAIIGGALGGLLGSLNGTGRNAFLENLNRAIDRDVQASTNQLNNLTQTLGSRQAAVKAATLSTLTQLSNDIDKRTAGIKNPAIIERAQSLKSQVEAQRAVVLGQSTALSLDQIKKRQDIELARREQNRKEAETVSQNQRRGVQNATDIGNLQNSTFKTQSDAAVDLAKIQEIQAKTRKLNRRGGGGGNPVGNVLGTPVSSTQTFTGPGGATIDQLPTKGLRPDERKELRTSLQLGRAQTDFVATVRKLGANPNLINDLSKENLNIISDNILAGLIISEGRGLSTEDAEKVRDALKLGDIQTVASFLNDEERLGALDTVQQLVVRDARQKVSELLPGHDVNFGAGVARIGRTPEKVKVTRQKVISSLRGASFEVDGSEKFSGGSIPASVKKLNSSVGEGRDPGDPIVPTSPLSRQAIKLFNQFNRDPQDPDNLKNLKVLLSLIHI